MISVIIPAFNEEESLEHAIVSVQKSSIKHEIIVVDAGSSDRTPSIAERRGARVFLSPARQRAAQMNLGAGHSRGEILLFVHADTILPSSALDSIERALKNERIVGGGFVRRFHSASLFLQCTCLLAEARNRAFGWFLGDQAIFARRSVFLKLGGFSPLDRFEDLDFSRRLGRIGRLAALRPPVVSSARRFQSEGPFRRTVRDFVLTMRYLQGDPRATEVAPKGPVKEHASYPAVRK